MVMPINTLSHKGEAALSRALLNLLDKSALVKFEKRADQVQQTLFQYLLQYHFVPAKDFQETCAALFDISTILLDQKNILQYENILNKEINHHLIMPIEKQDNQLTIAIANPSDLNLAKKISFHTGCKVAFKFARYDHLCRLHNAMTSNRLYQRIYETNEQLAKEVTHQFITDAIHRNASDIHVESYQYYLRIRFRIDGLLQEVIRIPNELTDAIISCIKILSNLDIAIRRMPQDGRMSFRTTLGFVKDCRISTCPTTFNEKIVIRLLNVHTQIRPIETLGLTTNNQHIIKNAIQKPQGLILITGPTGSGKTITLYTLLDLLNHPHRNITTIEDPIEMQVEGINQTPVSTKTGLTFSQILRTALRQDPDIIMIGEIRDQETADMSIRAAQTGHLVLSTLHTNSAPEAITRLSHMGVASYHLSSALLLVIAQRLVRKLCVFCKIKQNLSKKMITKANRQMIDEHYTPVGCTNCSNGYEGRFGIFELMPITTTLTQCILNNAPHTEIAKHNCLSGHINLWQAGLNAVRTGKTSLSEVYRVISEEEV